MRNKQTLFILILMLISLSGVVFVQLVWMNRAVEESRNKFDTETYRALRETIGKLEKKEQVVFLSNYVDIDPTSSNSTHTIIYTGKDSLNISKEFILSSKQLQGSQAISTTVQTEKNFMTESSKNRVSNDSIIVISGKEKKEKMEDFSGILEQMVIEFKSKEMPLEERLRREDISKLLSESLGRHNINLPYNFAVSKAQDSLVYKLSTPGFEWSENIYRAKLFPDEINETDYFLNLQFDSRNSYIFKSLSWLLIISLIFTLALIATFAYTLNVVIRQKKISRIKTDFINNITHEFKTPITTISVAADSLRNEQVKSDSAKQDYYTDVIRKENQKMNQRIEHILQISLENQTGVNGEFKKNNLSTVIKECCESVRLRVETKSGHINFSDKTTDPILFCDKDQIATMICNLTDNAIKYSEDQPQIEVSLGELKKDRLMITIKDQGIGIPKKEQNKIFERFYRVHTGDIHTVKGFGLGLSQVKSIVELHKGTITVKSEPGKGSSFSIVLPRNPLSHE